MEAPLPSGDPHLLHQREGRRLGFAALVLYWTSPSLTKEEQNDILFALQSLRATGSGTDSQEILSRLGSLFGDSAANWIDVDFSSWGSGPVERERFALLRQAIASRRVLHSPIAV